MKINNAHQLIDLYHTEKYLFDVVGPQIKKRGFLTFENFYKIGMWKSARQKQNYIQNKDIVEEVTRLAFCEKDEQKKIKILCKLKGVGIPTASAILTIVDPNKYAIIDIRCLQALRRILHVKISERVSLSTWVTYLSVMRNLAEENKMTPRELDMALFAMHRETLDGDGFRNLYQNL